METKLTLSALPPADGPKPAPASPPAPSHAQILQNDPADLRLVIERDPGVDGGYVYKTIDRRTGEVVLQLPREEVVRMQQSQDYASGAVIKAKA